MNDPVLLETDARGVATVTLNRPDVHNALDDEAIARLTAVFGALAHDARIRAVILTGAGKSFSAGADAGMMRRSGSMTFEENRAGALDFVRMLESVSGLSKPVIAHVNGAAMGGGVGLVACCDIALGLKTSLFALSEVKLGLIPAMISPYVIAAIGSRHARRYMLTGERFDGAAAERIGLLHAAFDDGAALRQAEAAIVDEILKSAPGAVADAKALIRDVSVLPAGADAGELTADRIACRRATVEAREGLSAFLEKRPPAWAVARAGAVAGTGK